MRIIKPVLIAMALWGTCSAASAQSTDTPVAGQLVENKDAWQFGLHALGGIPLCELHNNRYRTGIAFDMEILTPSLLSRTSPLAFQFGGHFDLMNSGWKKAEILVQDPANAEATYRLSNNSAGLHLMGCLSKRSGLIRPYLDGIIGFRGFFTSENIRLKKRHADYERSTQNEVFSKGTFIYGGSLGALVTLKEDIFLDFRITYSHGSRAKYADLDTFRKVGDGVGYSNLSSKTPLLFVNLGFVFNIYPGTGTGGSGDEGSDGGYRSSPRQKKSIKVNPPNTTPKT